MNRNLAMEFVRVTEAAAIASARLMGRGDEKAADQAAVDAMRTLLDTIDCDATVVIGEGERDEAPMLYIGEQVGTKNGPKLEIALDPLEGTTICAHGGPNSISVMAIGEQGGLLHAPDTYMLKIAAGREARGLLDIRQSPSENLKRLADIKKCRVADLTAIVLDRPRHKELIEEIRAAGARINLIGDGDVSAAIATATPNSGIDILFGIGGAPEGVIAAAALQCLGGEFQGVLKARNPGEIERARKMGIEDMNKVFTIDDLARGNLMFCATGVTTGNFLDGIVFKSWGCTSHSLVMRSQSGTIRHIRAEHHFDKKPRY
jgi:fructose-1,6-bisphosphatase class II